VFEWLLAKSAYTVYRQWH